MLLLAYIICTRRMAPHDCPALSSARGQCCVVMRPRLYQVTSEVMIFPEGFFPDEAADVLQKKQANQTTCGLL